MHRELAAILCLSLWTALATADDGAPAVSARHQITGLFSPDREPALREAFAKIPGIKLVSLDVEEAEATLEYAPGKLFPGAKPEQVVEGLDNLLKAASHYTLGVKPLRVLPREKLERVEIPVAGLDCEACCLAAYEAIYKVDGVEKATASFRRGRVTAWIDPARTDRSRLQDALKQRGVELVMP